MKKLQIYFLSGLVNLFISYPIFGQTIKCNQKLLKTLKFNSDTTFRFDNQFVRYNVVENIKKSNYELEIRMYTIGVDATYGHVILIQSNGSRMQLITKDTFFNKLMYGSKRTPISKNGQILGYEISSNRDLVVNCDLISNLISYDLFTIKSSTYNDFKPIGGRKPSVDSQEQYIFEIKAGDHYRNFQYTHIYGYEDTNEDRKIKMNQIIKLITDFCKPL